MEEQTGPLGDSAWVVKVEPHRAGGPETERTVVEVTRGGSAWVLKQADSPHLRCFARALVEAADRLEGKG